MVTEVSPVRTQRRTNYAKTLRQMHLWLGTLFAPSILFFAFTGALQLFSFHETRPGSTYEPPRWIERLAQIHKKQTMALKPKRSAPENKRPGVEQRRPQPAEAPMQPMSTVALKWFFLFMSAGLIVTTGLGIYMAFAYGRNATVTWALLAVGTILPAALVFM